VTDKLRNFLAGYGMHPESIEALAAGTVSEQCALELVLVLEQIAGRLVPND
jgi:hypothetical protein